MIERLERHSVDVWIASFRNVDSGLNGLGAGDLVISYQGSKRGCIQIGIFFRFYESPKVALTSVANHWSGDIVGLSKQNLACAFESMSLVQTDVLRR